MSIETESDRRVEQQSVAFLSVWLLCMGGYYYRIYLGPIFDNWILFGTAAIAVLPLVAASWCSNVPFLSQGWVRRNLVFLMPALILILAESGGWMNSTFDSSSVTSRDLEVIRIWHHSRDYVAFSSWRLPHAQERFAITCSEFSKFKTADALRIVIDSRKGWFGLEWVLRYRLYTPTKATTIARS